MNKSIYIHELLQLISKHAPGRFHREYAEWQQNESIIKLHRIIKNNPIKQLTKTSLTQVDSLYVSLWSEIAGSSACYTGDKPMTCVNSLLIAIAKLICSQFPERYPHYYYLLMPTAKNLTGQFMLSFEKVLETPLTELIVTENGTLLSALDTLEYAEKSKSLVNLEAESQPLTLFEKQQLLRKKNASLFISELMQLKPRLNDPTRVIDVRLVTMEQVRLLGIGCLHGFGTKSAEAIATFKDHLITLSRAEQNTLFQYCGFGTIWLQLIRGDLCIYISGQWFCEIAFDCIREESKWDANHIQPYFSRWIRNSLRETPIKYCRDKFIPDAGIDVTPDVIRANTELDTIIMFILKHKWSTDQIKCKLFKYRDKTNQEMSVLLPATIGKMFGMIVQQRNLRNINPIDILLQAKKILENAYFEERTKGNPSILSFYRSFYTEKHMQYMEDNLMKNPVIEESDDAVILIRHA